MPAGYSDSGSPGSVAGVGASASAGVASTGGGAVVAASSALASHWSISWVGRPNTVVPLGRVRTLCTIPTTPAISVAAKKLTQTSTVRSPWVDDVGLVRRMTPEAGDVRWVDARGGNGATRTGGDGRSSLR